MTKEYKLSPAELTILGNFRDQLAAHQRNIAAVEGAQQGALHLIAAQQGFKGPFHYEAGVMTQETVDLSAEDIKSAKIAK